VLRPVICVAIGLLACPEVAPEHEGRARLVVLARLDKGAQMQLEACLADATGKPEFEQLRVQLRNRGLAAGSTLPPAGTWDLALCFPESDLEARSRGLLPLAPGGSERMKAVWVVPYGLLRGHQPLPIANLWLATEVDLPDVRVESDFKDALASLLGTDPEGAVGRLREIASDLQLARSEQIRAAGAKEPARLGVVALRAAEVQPGQVVPATTLAAGISATTRAPELARALFQWLLAPAQRQRWCQRDVGADVEHAAAWQVMAKPSQRALDAVAAFVDGKPLEAPVPDDDSVFDTVLLLVFGGLFVVLLLRIVRSR